MIPILFTCSLWLPAIIGCGFHTLGLHGNIARSPLQRLSFSGLCGLLVLSTFSSAINFFFPVYPVFPLIAIAVGWTIFAVKRKHLLRGVTQKHFIAIIALLLMVSLAAARGRIEYDTGLYHLTAVKWMTSTPTPLGLANLYGRLGFNTAFFPLAAMLEAPTLLEKSTFILNPIFLTLFGLLIIDAAEHLLKNDFNTADGLILLSAYPWTYYGFTYASSLYCDAAVTLLTCLVMSLCLPSSHPARRYGDDPDSSAAKLSITLSLFALTLKLSAFPLLIGAASLNLIDHPPIPYPDTPKESRGEGRPRKKPRKGTTRLIPVWSITLLIWLARGIALTGSILYPSTFTRIDSFKWSVPIARLQVEIASIKDWAKYRALPWNVPPGHKWLSPWLARSFSTQPMIALATLLAASLILIAIYRPRPRLREIYALFIMLIGITFWFLTAPDIRFGYGYLFTFPAVLFCLAIKRQIKNLQPLLTPPLQFLAIAILLIASGYHRGLNAISWFRWPPLPTVPFITQRLSEGAVVYVPATHDQLWSAPLPTTPYPDPALRYTIDSQGRFETFWLDSTQPPWQVP